MRMCTREFNYEDNAKIGNGEMDEEEDHPVLVLLQQPLPQQVQQRVGVCC